MRSDAWEQTYAEFVAARQHELHRLALVAYPDRAQADAAVRRGLTDLYLAWPRVRREGTEDSEALRLVLGTSERPPTRAGVLVDEHDPPSRPVEEYVAAGRATRRRRRRTAWVAGLAGLVLAAGATAALLPRSTGAGGGIGPHPLPRPTVATPIPIRLLVPPRRYLRPDSPPIFYLYGRMFRRSEGVTVLATFGTPEPTTYPRGGGIVRVGGSTVWVVTVGNEPEALTEQRAGPYDPDAFKEWQAAEQPVLSGRLALAATSPGGYRPPVADEDSPATFAGGRLVARPGGEVVQRISDPVVSPSAVPSCRDQAVRVHPASRQPGGDWFVLGFACPTGSALYSEPVGVRADSLAAWLVDVRRVQDRYAS